MIRLYGVGNRATLSRHNLHHKSILCGPYVKFTPEEYLGGVALLVFIVLDIGMVVSLVKPGDERNQIIVWKASAYSSGNNDS